jgi:hypothetical protein
MQALKFTKLWASEVYMLISATMAQLSRSIGLAVVWLCVPLAAAHAAGQPLAVPAPVAVSSTSTPTSTGADKSADQAPAQPWSNQWGSRGLNRLHSATLLPRHELTLSFHPYAAVSKNLLLPSDKNTLQRQTFSLVYGITDSLELSLSYEQIINTNSTFSFEEARSLGDPRVAMRYGLSPLPKLHLAALFSVTVPTAAKNPGLTFKGLGVTAQAQATYLALSWLQASANVGYTYDGRNLVFQGQSLNRAQLFAAGVPVSSHLNAGLGLSTLFAAGTVADLGPYVELMAAYAPSASLREDPILASVGLKVAPNGSRRWEFGAGAELRLSGAPANNNHFAGVPPWGAFAQVTIHVGDCGAGVTACTTTQDCVAGTCSGGFCRSDLQAPTYVIDGSVVHGVTGAPVSGAVVTLAAQPDTHYAADGTGHFVSAPVAVQAQAATVMVDAPDFVAVRQSLTPGAPGSRLPVRIAMMPADRPSEGAIRGIVLSSTNGKPVSQAFIFLPTLQVKLRTNEQGAFTGRLRMGRHQVLVYAKGYLTQRKEISIGRDDTIILNVDMHPEGRPGSGVR